MNVESLLELVTVGATLGEAIDNAVVRFGCSRSDIDIEILQTPSSGWLGLFGRRPARVRVRLRCRLIAASRVTNQILDLCGFSALSKIYRAATGLRIDLEAADAALLIGRHGQVLESLELLVNHLLNRSLGFGDQVDIDCNGYRSSRSESSLRRAFSQPGKPRVAEVTHPGPAELGRFNRVIRPDSDRQQNLSRRRR